MNVELSYHYHHHNYQRYNAHADEELDGPVVSAHQRAIGEVKQR
jgi:hypothetical protein